MGIILQVADNTTRYAAIAGNPISIQRVFENDEFLWHLSTQVSLWMSKEDKDNGVEPFQHVTVNKTVDTVPITSTYITLYGEYKLHLGPHEDHI